MVVIANAMKCIVDGSCEHGDTVWTQTIACKDRWEEEGATESSVDRGTFHLRLGNFSQNG